MQIFVVNSGDVAVDELTKKGTEKVSVRYLIDERHGSARFSLRLYTVGVGGHTPLGQHEYEHHVYILEGHGILKGDDSVLRQVHKGDSIFVPSNAVHQFITEGHDPLVFLCVKGNPNIYQRPRRKTEPVSGSPAGDFC